MASQPQHYDKYLVEDELPKHSAILYELGSTSPPRTPAPGLYRDSAKTRTKRPWLIAAMIMLIVVVVVVAASVGGVFGKKAADEKR